MAESTRSLGAGKLDMGLDGSILGLFVVAWSVASFAGIGIRSCCFNSAEGQVSLL